MCIYSYIPVAFVIFRASVVKLLQQGHEPVPLSTPAHVILTIIMLYGCMGCVLVLTAAGFTNGNLFGVILDFTGGIAMSIVCFIIPAVIYLTAYYPDPLHAIWWYHCILMLCFGLFATIAVPVASALSFS